MGNAVNMVEGTPDARYAQDFTRKLGMGLSVKLVVPHGLSNEQAWDYVQERLERAVRAVPELSFTAVIGEPNL